MKHRIILILVIFFSPFACANGEKDSGNLIAITIDFGNKRLPDVLEIKSDIIKNGFDWSSVFAYSAQKNRVMFVVRELAPSKPHITKLKGGADLYLLLGRLRTKYEYTLEPVGSFQVLNHDKSKEPVPNNRN